MIKWLKIKMFIATFENIDSKNLLIFEKKHGINNIEKMKKS